MGFTTRKDEVGGHLPCFGLFVIETGVSDAQGQRGPHIFGSFSPEKREFTAPKSGSLPFSGLSYLKKGVYGAECRKGEG